MGGLPGRLTAGQIVEDRRRGLASRYVREEDRLSAGRVTGCNLRRWWAA
jgi:hypothetical protein